MLGFRIWSTIWAVDFLTYRWNFFPQNHHDMLFVTLKTSIRNFGLLLHHNLVLVHDLLLTSCVCLFLIIFACDNWYPGRMTRWVKARQSIGSNLKCLLTLIYKHPSKMNLASCNPLDSKQLIINQHMWAKLKSKNFATNLLLQSTISLHSQWVLTQLVRSGLVSKGSQVWFPQPT